VATYLRAYQDHLKGVLEQGGASAAMESCVEEFNAAGAPDFVSSPSFLSWVEGTAHTCSTCHRSYRIDVPASEEQTCSVCRETKP